MMATRPPGRHTRSISARPASPPCPGEGVKAEQATTRSAESSGSGSWSKNPWITWTRSPWSAAASFRRRIRRNGRAGSTATTLPPTLDELHRQPSRARADLGDPVHVARQPADDPGMEPLGAGQPVIELRFEPVQQFPGQDHVALRITVPLRDEPARLLAGEHGQVRGRVPVPQLPARPGRSLRPGHRPRPSSCRSPRPGPTAAARAGSSGRSRSQMAWARFSAVGTRPLSHGTSVFRLR